MGEITQAKTAKKLFDNSDLNKIAQLIETNVKIRDIESDQTLIETLRYCFVLIGLLPNQYPNKIEQTVLIDFIKSNYKLLHPDEIRIAFQMGATGELNKYAQNAMITNEAGTNKLIQNFDMNCFGNFSPSYFGRVMAVYREARLKVAIELDHHQRKFLNEISYIPDNVKKVQYQREYDANVIKPMFDKFKQFGVIDLGFTNAKMVYDSLTGFHKVKEFSKDEKTEIMKEAVQVLERKKKDIQELRPINYQQHKEKIKKLGELIEPDVVDKEIVNECYVLCIQKCFEIMKANEFKF